MTDDLPYAESEDQGFVVISKYVGASSAEIGPEQDEVSHDVVTSMGRFDLDQLCEICQSINFHTLFLNDDVYIPDSSGYQCPPRTVGYVTNHESACAFCMITGLCLRTLRLDKIEGSEAYTVTSHAITAGSIKFTGASNGKNAAGTELNTPPAVSSPSFVRIVFRVCELANQNDIYYFTTVDLGEGGTLIEMRERSCYNEDTRIGLQAYCPPQLDRLTIALSGRAVPSSIDFSLVNAWLSESDEAEQPTERTSEIILIDIDNGCLVNANTGYTYVALSYVWGRAQQFQLTNTTRDFLYKELAIFEAWDNIPGTICDAMIVCEALGLQYLWVDSLCIPQDDQAQKLAQVQSMDDVYGNAYLTIVNASRGDRVDANSLLPGVRPNTRKVFQLHGGTESIGFLINSCPRLQDDLDLAPWRRRAWTFQEEFLSKRLLFFTNSQCFLQVGKRIYCEDQFLEAPEPRWVAVPLTLGTTRSWHYTAQNRFRNEFDLIDYCYIIEAYVKRSLTFAEDAIRAVFGLLRKFSSSIDGRSNHFISGHPSAAFDFSLCWTANQYAPNSRRSEFPSWSWASRVHHILFDDSHAIGRDANLTWQGPTAASLYTDNLSEGKFTLNNICKSETGHDVLPVRMSKHKKLLYYQNYSLDPTTFAERELHFTTSCVKFRVARYCSRAGEEFDIGRTEHVAPWGLFHVSADVPNTNDPTKITQKMIGSIKLESSWRDEQPEELYLDFIVIRAVPNNELYCNIDQKSVRASKGTPQNVSNSSSTAEAGSANMSLSPYEVIRQETPNLTPSYSGPTLKAYDSETYKGVKVDRSFRPAAEWRLTLMCIEWQEVSSNSLDASGEPLKRRVATRLDVLRHGPSVNEWIAMGAQRIEVVLA